MEEAILDTGNHELEQNLIHKVAIPVGIIFGIFFVVCAVYKYLASLYVTGEANQWVVILNNGKMKAAGVGLCTMRGPFDQVAKFPSQVNKVTFRTEQVTKEMQGIQVEGMLVWSINRIDDGPFNAYKNLGDDLATNDPKTANDNLTSMACSIVRSAIANSTIETMLRDRASLRQ